MSPRHRLANRRALDTYGIEHEGQRFKISLGRELICVDRKRVGPVMEVFVSAQKVNSPIDVLVGDGGILLSLLLQHGCPIETIHHAMKRSPDGSPSSPLGRAAALIMEASASS
jgi:hypothetical protein